MGRTHALCSPSKLKHRAICPSYLGDDNGPAHPLTESGTRCHDALEEDDDSALDETEQELVAYAREYLRRLPKPDAVYREIELDTGVEDVRGYADELRVNNRAGSAHLVDFKFGFHWQGDARDNLQGKAYALGVFREWSNIDTVTVHFIYPRINRATRHTFTRHDVPEMFNEVEGIRHRWATESGVTFNYDSTNCHFCARRFSCPAVRDRFAPVLPQLPPLVAPGSSDDPNTVAEQLRAGALLETFAKRFRDETKKHATKLRVEEGTNIPGFDLREVSNGTEVTDPIRVLSIAINELGIAPAEAAEAVTLSIPKLADTYATRAPRGEKKQWREEFLGELAARGLTEPKLSERWIALKTRGGDDAARLTENRETE